MKKILMIFSLLLFGGGMLLAQRTVVGQITGADGLPLIGATILAQGSDAGTVTDLDGKFELAVPASTTVLEISYTGFESQEITLGASNVVNLTLNDDVKQLSEIVVTALGVERERKELGYSVTTVDGDDLANVRASNALEALSGRVPGLRTNMSSGTAGGSVNVLIRERTV